MTCLVIVHDRLVNEVSAIDELALASAAILLVQEGDAIVHVQGGLRSRRHATILLL